MVPVQLAPITIYRVIPEVGIPQFKAQVAQAEVAKRFNKLFLAFAQLALAALQGK